MAEAEVITELTSEECWGMLRAEEFGRLAFRLRSLLPEDEAHRAETTRLRSWIPTAKYNVVQIAPDAGSGREFALARPWLQLRLDES